MRFDYSYFSARLISQDANYRPIHGDFRWSSGRVMSYTLKVCEYKMRSLPLSPGPGKMGKYRITIGSRDLWRRFIGGVRKMANSWFFFFLRRKEKIKLDVSLSASERSTCTRIARLRIVRRTRASWNLQFPRKPFVLIVHDVGFREKLIKKKIKKKYTLLATGASTRSGIAISHLLCAANGAGETPFKGFYSLREATERTLRPTRNIIYLLYSRRSARPWRTVQFLAIVPGLGAEVNVSRNVFVPTPKKKSVGGTSGTKTKYIFYRQKSGTKLHRYARY